MSKIYKKLILERAIEEAISKIEFEVRYFERKEIWKWEDVRSLLDGLNKVSLFLRDKLKEVE